MTTKATKAKRAKLADYDFVEKPSGDFYCPVTFELLREPHQTLCCGNHLSQEVATELNGKSCPLCMKPDFRTMPDKFFQRKVNEFKIRCPNKSLGCEWVGELGNLDRHLSQNSVEGECQFVTVACPYSCGDGFQRCQLEGHKANDCPNRPFTCQYCGHKATYHKVTDEHMLVCKKHPVECPNKSQGCQWAGQQGHLDWHLQDDSGCQYAEVACEFSYAGCKVKLPRRLLQAHLTENVKGHLSMVGQNLQQKNDQQQQMIVQLQGVVTKLQQTIAKQQQTFESLVSRMYDITMADFQKHKEARDSWYSPPFYSHIGGYKMCLRVFANGDGVGEGTHISVFVVLVEGENDNQLKWPFRGDVTIQLLDQRRDEGHWEGTVMFDDRVERESQRVVGRNISGGWGYSQFIAHTQLNTENREFLKNNCLKFRILEVNC